MANKRATGMMIVLIMMVWSMAAIAADGAGLGPDEALQKLMAGNKRFVGSQIKHRSATIREARAKLVKGQKPYAIILSCSDSRVPPEIVFDETLGQLFVVRVAGNVVDPVVLGSIEYAVSHLGTSLIMVLGHEACGAVTAAMDATGKTEGNIAAVLDLIMPAVQNVQNTMEGRNRPDLVEVAIDRNIDLQAENLTRQSPIIKDYVGQGKVRIVKGKYHLYHGDVTLLK
jgi:carbonic anhydrase